MTDTTADVIKRTLVELFTDAAGADRLVSVEEVRKAGIPRKWAEAVSRASKGIVASEQVDPAATDLADRIGFDMDTLDRMSDPAELAKLTPRY